MKILEGEEKKKALIFIKKAAKIAQLATCERAKCGSVIVKDDEIIGNGFNSPPGNFELQRRCKNRKSQYDMKVTDKTCCVHAEQRAIIDALSKNPQKLRDSALYFIKIDENNNLTKAKSPYCTICSKMTLDVGIKEFVLYTEKGICVYDTKEYNDISFNYKSNK